jgi:RHS repeat-associated protein
VRVGSGSTSTLSYLASDQLGSVTVALSASGSVIAQQLYSPYGNVRYSSGQMSSVTDHGYTGQIADVATGLSYYGARYYDPALGEFTSADTTSAGGLNRYAYVGGNPETATDPSGHRTCTDPDSCGGAYRSAYSTLQWAAIFYQDATSDSSGATALNMYLFSPTAWTLAETYVEEGLGTSLMGLTGQAAVTYLQGHAGVVGQASADAMSEYAALQTARAWGVIAATGAMYDGPHDLAMLHGAQVSSGGLLGDGNSGELGAGVPLTSELEGDGAGGSGGDGGGVRLVGRAGADAEGPAGSCMAEAAAVRKAAAAGAIGYIVV